MKHITFRNTDLHVTPLCLGTVNYGSAMNDDASVHQLSHYVELGGNFIDTARIYGVWANRGDALSEKIIGRWLQETGVRDKIVLATKGAHPDWDTMDIKRVQPAMIEYDLDQSLLNLGTDYIDLYFLHRDDPDVPVVDILYTLEKAVKEGKIRYYGCSNWKLDRVMEAGEAAKAEGFKGFVCNQLMWSLADVHFDGLTDKTFVLMDKKTWNYHRDNGLNAMAYMSVAKGYFMRRMALENLPASVRDVYDTPENDAIFQMLQDRIIDPLQASLVYLMRQPFPSVPIASFDNDRQLEEAMRCCDVDMPQETLDALAQIKKYVV